MTEFTHLTKQQFGQKHMACVNHQIFKLFRFISSKVNTFMQNPAKTKVWKQQTVPTFVVTMFKNWPKIGCPIIYIFDITGGTYFRARSSKFVEPWSEVSPTKGSALLVWINFFVFLFCPGCGFRHDIEASLLIYSWVIWHLGVSRELSWAKGNSTQSTLYILGQ